MIVVSWNYRGLGNALKTLVVKVLIKSEKPSILLQETKMKEDDISTIGKGLWKSSNLIVKDARDASGGLCTLWSEQVVRLEHHIKFWHWLLTKFYHNKRSSIITIINVYMLENPSENSKC
jgi:exonuclease III